MFDRITRLWIERQYRMALRAALTGVLASGQRGTEEELVGQASRYAKVAVKVITQESASSAAGVH